MYSAVILQLLLIAVTSAAPVDVTDATTESANISISTQSFAADDNADIEGSVLAPVCSQILESLDYRTFRRDYIDSYTICTCVTPSRSVCPPVTYYPTVSPGSPSAAHNSEHRPSEESFESASRLALQQSCYWSQHAGRKCVFLDDEQGRPVCDCDVLVSETDGDVDEGRSDEGAGRYEMKEEEASGMMEQLTDLEDSLDEHSGEGQDEVEEGQNIESDQSGGVLLAESESSDEGDLSEEDDSSEEGDSSDENDSSEEDDSSDEGDSSDEDDSSEEDDSTDEDDLSDEDDSSEEDNSSDEDESSGESESDEDEGESSGEVDDQDEQLEQSDDGANDRSEKQEEGGDDSEDVSIHGMDMIIMHEVSI